MIEEILEFSYNKPYVKPYRGMKINWQDAAGKLRFAHITKINPENTWVIWDMATEPQAYSNRDFEKYLKEGTFKQDLK